MLEEFVSVTPNISRLTNEEFMKEVHKYIIKAADDICEMDRIYLKGAFGKNN